MNIPSYNIIFSEKKKTRLFRHVLFWTAWAAYFVLCDYLFRQPRPDVATYGTPKTGYLTLGSNWLIKTCLLLSLYAGVCYFFINILLPQIIQRQWIKASINTFLLCLILFLLASFMYWNVFSFIDSLSGINKAANYFAPFWPPLYLGVINAGKVVASAAIIKSVKYWWLKQKEKEKLEREKMIAELQLLKAQIRPDFLFGALSNIQTHSLNASARAPELLLKLSDLLSYMLYECDKSFVPIEQEIAMMKNYMEIEKTRLEGYFETELNVRGAFNDEKIAPFLLLPFIENFFHNTGPSNTDRWLNMDIEVIEKQFSLKLANGIIDGVNDSLERTTNGLEKVQKRLTLIYPQHELKIYRQQEMLITFLKFQLNEPDVVEVSKVAEPVL